MNMSNIKEAIKPANAGSAKVETKTEDKVEAKVEAKVETVEAPKTLADMAAEIAKLKAENNDLKIASSRALSCKVSQKGAVSLYGLGRFPITLYKEQWEKVLASTDMVSAFIKTHNSELSVKGSKVVEPITS